MGENTKIEWADHTFNPWIGCTKVAAGCEHCYAERDMDKRLGRAKWGPHGTRVKTSAANWAKPLKWNREAEQLGQRQRVFCASLADVFEAWTGPIVVRVDGGDVNLGTDGRASRGPEDRLTMNDLRRDLFALIDATPWLIWLLVTKRPENIRKMWPEEARVTSGEARDPTASQLAPRAYRSSVWLLTSIATQADANRNIPELLRCRDLVPVLGVSAEPLLGPVELRVARPEARESRSSQLAPLALDSWLPALDWLIVGGESGPHARPMHPAWVSSIRDQCQAAGVPFHFKQWGEWVGGDHPIAIADRRSHEEMRDRGKVHVWPFRMPSGPPHFGMNFSLHVGKAKAGRLLDGHEWNEFPVVESQGSRVESQHPTSTL